MHFKVVLTTVLFLASTFTYLAQKNDANQGLKNFTITNLGTVYTSNQLTSAVEKADWCGYFHQTLRYTIIFEDGAIVELLSKKELTGSEKLNDACFQNENTKDNGIYKIHESGILIRMMSAKNTSKN